MYVLIDNMYLMVAMISGVPNERPLTSYVQMAFDVRIKSAISLLLLNCSVCSVKFSFLFLFRKLIDRVRPTLVYWWLATIFNLAAFAYGCVAAFAVRPYLNYLENCTFA